MSDLLAQNLREWRPVDGIGLWPLMAEAADALDAKDAEIARLREAVEEWALRYYWRAEGMRVEQARIHAKALVNAERARQALS